MIMIFERRKRTQNAPLYLFLVNFVSIYVSLLITSPMLPFYTYLQELSVVQGVKQLKRIQ